MRHSFRRWTWVKLTVGGSHHGLMFFFAGSFSRDIDGCAQEGGFLFQEEKVGPRRLRLIEGQRKQKPLDINGIGNTYAPCTHRC